MIKIKRKNKILKNQIAKNQSIFKDLNNKLIEKHYNQFKIKEG